MKRKITKTEEVKKKIKLLDLDDKCLYEIFKRLDTNDLVNLQKCNKRLYISVENYKRIHKYFYEKQLKSSVKFLNTSYSSFSLILVTFFIISLAIIPLRMTNNGSENSHEKDMQQKTEEIHINLDYIDEINNKYPGLLSPKQIRIIKTRLTVMKNEVSVLMLLGKSRDSHCKLDPTFCVGQTIANVTQLQFGYIDASDPDLHSDEIKNILRSSLEGIRYTVMIDSLEKLPGREVMNLFQYIDKDDVSSQGTRRGMLLFIVYTGLDLYNQQQQVRMKEADVVESILMERWSPYIPKDSLTSVISRMSSSIVKVF